MNQATEDKLMTSGIVVFFLIVFSVVIALGMWGCPQYNVWEQGLQGQAALARAEQEKRIQIEQAQAERNSATLRAEAIEIMGKAAKEYPEYRYQEFLGSFAEALQEGKIDQIIYVPTEANIPIMEAGKR